MRTSGSILITVLVLAALLGVLAAIASEVVWAGFGASRSFAEDIRAELAARAVLEKVVAESSGDNLASASTARLAGAVAQLTLRDEAARVDLNRAPKELIGGVFRVAGVEADAADRLAARVVDFRDEDDRPTEGGAERDAYRGAGRADGPANRPFAHVAELGRVLGISPTVAAVASQYFTVGSGLEAVNPMLADPATLLAIPGVTPARAQEFIEGREQAPGDFKRLVGRLGTSVQKFVTEDRGKALRAEILVQLGAGNIRRFEAIIAPGQGTKPYRVLSWQAHAPELRRELP